MLELLLSAWEGQSFYAQSSFQSKCVSSRYINALSLIVLILLLNNEMISFRHRSCLSLVLVYYHCFSWGIIWCILANMAECVSVNMNDMCSFVWFLIRSKSQLGCKYEKKMKRKEAVNVYSHVLAGVSECLCVQWNCYAVRLVCSI